MAALTAFRYYTVEAEDCRIRCKLYGPDAGAVKTLILFGHGFGGHKDNRAAEKLARRVREKNPDAALVVFNWPCHGDDERQTLRLDDCMRYLELLIADTQARFSPETLYGCATSFGGYLYLLYLAGHDNPFRKLVFRCPAIPMYEVLTRAIMPNGLLESVENGTPALVGFDRKVGIDRGFLESLRAAELSARDYSPLAADMLILHGTEDEIVPFAAVKAFAEKNGIAFVPVDGADHRFLAPGTMDLAIARTVAFFSLE